MPKKEYGTELRRFRRESGRTMAHLADAIDCSIVYISDIERGRRNPPSRAKTQRLLMALGKQEHLSEMLALAVEARRSVEIPVDGKSREVTNMLAALAREADEGALDKDIAEQIQKLLEERGRR